MEQPFSGLAFWLVLAAVTTVSGTAQPPASPSQQPTALTQGAVIEKSLEGSARDEYALHLRAGDYARVSVAQKGVDVVVTVAGDGGKTLASFDDDPRPEGHEDVQVVSSTDSDLRLVVAPVYRRHAAGSYAISLDAVRAATDGDRSVFDSRRLLYQAGQLTHAGKYRDALPLLERAEREAEGALGDSNAYVADVLRGLAGVQRQVGDTAVAEQSYKRALGICEAVLGHDNPQTAQTMSQLGALYSAEDEYARAQPLLEDVVRITERTLGEHPRLATELMTLSLLYLRRGDMDRATDVLLRAHAIAEKAMSPDDFWSIAIVNNLADLYISKQQYERARPYAERALRDIERTMGADNVRVATPLLNLGIIARETGDFAHALEYLQRAYRTLERTYGAEHTQTASILISIGNVYREQRDYTAAGQAYESAIDVLSRTAGPYHSLTLLAINQAAQNALAAGDAPRALALQSQFDAALDKAITYNLAIGSERQRVAYLQSTMERMGRAISLHLSYMPHSAAAATLAESAILRRKGRVLEALTDNVAALRQRLDAGSRALLDELASTTARVSTLALSGPGSRPAAEYRKELAALQVKQEGLEAEIGRRSRRFVAEMEPADLAAVQAALPAHAALVDFAVYEPFDAAAPSIERAHGPPRYAAYVVSKQAAPRGVDLGAVSRIDAAVERARKAFRDPRRADAVALARELDRLLLGPLRPLLGRATQLLISPDGALNFVPFGALVDARGHFAVERYAIAYLGSGRDLVRMQVPRASAAPPLIVANPAFGTPVSDADFTPLAGTAQEAAAIARLFPHATVLTGARATKASLARRAAPSILHIASHAFFKSTTPQADGGGAEGPRGGTATVLADNPLLRAGIALAGANTPANRDRSILTALDASTLNLWGTQLVTLSACDTGVGDVTNGEGVYGLRRAFFLAGAESIVMTLWPVSDYTTRTVITRYYAGLARGLGRGEALRRVQLAMLADPARRHPFYWAGFIQAGDWRPLEKGATSR